MKLTRADERYQHDPAFRTLVDVLCHHITSLDYTSSDLREAAIFAGIMVERLRPSRPIFRDYSEGW